MEYFFSSFSVFSEVISFISNICVLILTIYTLYLTAFSRRMDYVSMGQSFSPFYGDTIHICIRNCSLHSIPITKVFLFKKINGTFQRIAIAEYDQPLIVEAWHIGKIESEPFTVIEGLNDKENESDSGYSGLHMNAVIGIESGDKIIWIKPYKKAPLRKAKIAYRKHEYEILSVFRKCYNDIVLSKSVNYVIDLVCMDINCQKTIKTIFAMTGKENMILSDAICGYNGIENQQCNSANELKQILCRQFGIEENNIMVQTI